ncbi:hypothetical protein Dxin01_03238 [Deinococcus xinjiangensis]|uniref:Uncharacterized protein n=1 Tax=Deinococcus xinjiangensis TaxID=457454 RepID=A0ABP9VGT2_9DEIO
MQELSCTWVPGTIDIVRLRVGKRQIEMTSARLSKIFGPHALNDLYLKGRVVIKAEAQQVAMLA